MREKITYIADDETEFDNKEECMAYEAEQTNRFQQVKNNVLAFDKDGRVLVFDNEDDFMEIYDQIDYLIVTTTIPSDSVQFIEDRGYCTIPITKGAYHYSSAAYEWDNYSVWNPIKEYIKEYIEG